MFWSKTFTENGQLVVAICDEDLLGKRIGSKFKVEIKESFYKGEKIDEKKAIDLMGKAYICNLMGKNIVELALEKKFISKENIIQINGVSHAQFIK
jgi:hypothetical protein